MSEEREATPGEQAAQVYADETSTSSSLEPGAVGSVLDELLEGERTGSSEQTATSFPAIRTARLVAVEGRRATIVWRGNTTPVEASIDTDVEEELLVRALRNRDGVLVEMYENDKLLVVGVLQKRLPREVHISADEIHFDAARELVLRAGRAALRLREDGDVELVGSRISAASRGLFRLVGRMLRLN
jgi:hypothetical protein